MVPGNFGWGSVVFDAMTTLAPWPAAIRPIAFPIPLLAPVMKMVFPWRLGMTLSKLDGKYLQESVAENSAEAYFMAIQESVLPLAARPGPGLIAGRTCTFETERKT